MGHAAAGLPAASPKAPYNRSTRLGDRLRDAACWSERYPSRSGQLEAVSHPLPPLSVENGYEEVYKSV